jgi:transketolase
MRRKLADQNATDWINSAIYLDLVQKKEPLGTKTRDLTKAFNERFPETELDVYTDMEVTYNASILKLKSHENENNLNQDVRKVFNKALRTLKMKMSDLLLSKAFYSISEKYKEETKEL